MGGGERGGWQGVSLLFNRVDIMIGEILANRWKSVKIFQTFSQNEF